MFVIGTFTLHIGMMVFKEGKGEEGGGGIGGGGGGGGGGGEVQGGEC